MSMNLYNCWERAQAAIAMYRTVLLYGPPGTGKTWIAYNAGRIDSNMVISTTCTDSTPAAEFRGHFIPSVQENGDGSFSSVFTWMDGPAVVAWDKGYRLVINEIDHADADLHSFLHAVLDDADMAELTLPNLVKVTPEPTFHCIATMNGIPEDLPPALLDRFKAKVLIDTPAPGAIAALPDDLRGPALSTVGIQDAERRVSIRSWFAFAEGREKSQNPQLAAEIVFGAQAADVLAAIQMQGPDAAPPIDDAQAAEAAVYGAAEAPQSLLSAIRENDRRWWGRSSE